MKTVCRAAIALAFASGMLTSCSTSNTPLKTVSDFEPARYAGVWHEVARLPNRFERDLVAARATYGNLGDGTLSVLNEGVKAGGETTSISGTATPAGEAKFNIRFDRFPASLFAGDYWVLWVDPHYEKAIVGTPDRKFLWLLAKNPETRQADFSQTLAAFDSRGFSTGLLFENPKRIR